MIMCRNVHIANNLLFNAIWNPFSFFFLSILGLNPKLYNILNFSLQFHELIEVMLS